MIMSATLKEQNKGEQVPETKPQAPWQDWIRILKIIIIKKRRMPLSK